MTETDDLVQRLQRKDPEGFKELLRRHSRELYGLAYSLMGNAADAQDVVQQALIGALRGIERFEGRSSLKTWLFTILVNQAGKARRSRKVRRAGPLDGSGESAEEVMAPASRRGGLAADTQSPAIAVDSRLDVDKMLQVLAPDHREVIVLRELQGLSYEEIAVALGIPRGTVESRLFRARQVLRSRFASHVE